MITYIYFLKIFTRVTLEKYVQGTYNWLIVQLSYFDNSLKYNNLILFSDFILIFTQILNPVLNSRISAIPDIANRETFYLVLFLQCRISLYESYYTQYTLNAIVQLFQVIVFFVVSLKGKKISCLLLMPFVCDYQPKVKKRLQW